MPYGQRSDWGGIERVVTGDNGASVPVETTVNRQRLLFSNGGRDGRRYGDKPKVIDMVGRGMVLLPFSPWAYVN